MESLWFLWPMFFHLTYQGLVRAFHIWDGPVLILGPCLHVCIQAKG